MAQRERDPRLKELHDQGVHIYSFSKLGTICECLYGAYLTYVKHEKGAPNIYSHIGSVIHDTLQEIVEDDAPTSLLAERFENGMTEADSVGLSFPKDMRGNDSIRKRYVDNMNHFCKYFVPPKGKFDCEKLLILKVSDTRAVQGYSDIIQYFSDGSVRVLDWKTSSRYKASNLLEHGRQLVIYTMALEQMGYKTRAPGWIMLKYVEITYKGRKSKSAKANTTITKVCDRSKIFDTIGLPVARMLEQNNVDDIEQEILLHDFQKTNSLDNMPSYIKDAFIIKPYVEYYNVTDELRQECIDYINRVADKYESLDKDDPSQWPARRIDKSCSFYCNSLCDFRCKCEDIAEYNRTISSMSKSDSEMDDLF